LSRTLKILKVWWWLFASYALFVFIVGAFIFINLPPEYSTTSKIFVTSSSSSALANVYDAPYTDRAVKTVLILIESNEVISSIANATGKDEKEIKKIFSARSVVGTQVIEIKVKGQNIGLVSTIAELIPQTLEEHLKNIQIGTDAGEKNQIKTSVAEQPTYPEEDTSNKIKYLGLFLFVAIFVGYGLYSFLGVVGRNIKDPADIESTGINYLGEFGRLAKIDEDIGLVLDEKNSHIAESLREIRTGLLLSDKNGVICITSLKPKEGKSSFASGLSLILAEMGKRTVLIDADVRAPSIAKIFSLRATEGLTDFLEKKVTKDKIVYKSGFENLWVVPSGSKSGQQSASLINKEKLLELNSWLKEVGNVDYVLIDTPPINTFKDASLISQVTDGILIVVESGKISHRDLIKARNEIKKIETKILGGILTKTQNKKRVEYY